MFTYEEGTAHVLHMTILHVHIFCSFKEKKGGGMKDPIIPRTKFFTFVN